MKGKGGGDLVQDSASWYRLAEADNYAVLGRGSGRWEIPLSQGG